MPRIFWTLKKTPPENVVAVHCNAYVDYKMHKIESDLTDEEKELLRLLDKDRVIPPLPPEHEQQLLAKLGIPRRTASPEVDTESDLTDEEKELLRLLDKDRVIPPLPPEHEQQLLAKL